MPDKEKNILWWREYIVTLRSKAKSQTNESRC